MNPKTEETLKALRFEADIYVGGVKRDQLAGAGRYGGH